MKDSLQQTYTQTTSPQGLANNLSELMKKKHIRANQLARELEIPVITINRLLANETMDPRISTLKLIADYFAVPVDVLMYGKNFSATIDNFQNSLSQLIPILDWDNALSQNKETVNMEWITVTLEKGSSLSKCAFALKSRPVMAPRYPQGSLFIVDPTVKPTDGDVVLVRFKEDQELTLRELKIDLPEKFLLSLTTATKAIEYHQDFHEIVGVNMLTVLYNQRILR